MKTSLKYSTALPAQFSGVRIRRRGPSHAEIRALIAAQYSDARWLKYSRRSLNADIAAWVTQMIGRG